MHFLIHLFRVKYLLIIAVVFLILNSFFFLVAGAIKCIDGYQMFFYSGLNTSEEQRPGLLLLEGLDFFMVSLVFMIFGLGIGRLFLLDHLKDEDTPKWIRIHNLTELKYLLWETLLTTLAILSLTNIVEHGMHEINDLYFPAVILILALSLFLMRKSGNNLHH